MKKVWPWSSLQIREKSPIAEMFKIKKTFYSATVTQLCNLYVLGIFQLARDVIIIPLESDYEFGVSVLKRCPRASKLP